MRVKCLKNKGTDLSEKAMNVSGTVHTEFSLNIGTEYMVYSISLCKGILRYLILGKDENLPSWYPAELFEITDNLLPIEWYYAFYPNQVVSAIWGYKEIIFDSKHNIDLIEREDHAIRIFLKRKTEIDEYV